jgi:hypothetical protein
LIIAYTPLRKTAKTEYSVSAEGTQIEITHGFGERICYLVKAWEIEWLNIIQISSKILDHFFSDNKGNVFSRV